MGVRGCAGEASEAACGAAGAFDDPNIVGVSEGDLGSADGRGAEKTCGRSGCREEGQRSDGDEGEVFSHGFFQVGSL